MSEQPQNTEVHIDENKLIAERKQKLAELREAGQAFPNDFRRDAYCTDLQNRFGSMENDVLEADKQFFSVAGRIMLKRVMGKASFTTIQDMTGRTQLYISRDAVGEETYSSFKKWDIGDIVGARGYVFKTKTGELSVHVEELRLLTKSLRPLPEKFHGMTDQEMKYRQRYVDLIMSEDTRRTFRIRSQVVEGIRRFMTNRDFMEVETPMMHVIPGGAAAKPFNTHHNALDMPLFLRIAPELYLKRLVVGGFERVFEINRNFRNEGVSARHNPEFTMIEFYQAYADYRDLMDLTEAMLRTLAEDILGNTEVEYQGEVFDFGQPFERISMVDSILKYNTDLTREQLWDIDQAAEIIRSKLKMAVKPIWGIGKLHTIIFEETVEAQLRQPTFITEYPAEVSPLARRNDHNEFITDRFEFFIGGREIANGFSELNDPEDQAERFHHQMREKDAGDDEAMHYDADYIRALEYGLPPTAGEGIGIDRLVMIFTNAPSIRDVILFPHMRPEH
ncbi:MAG: lysine--tRNA ligase [Moraxellaceae bacterium]|jgi:lysyl-tRNA synthetase class 2|nr:lysine--tRNA ligase [Moraxellaceae bacterium]MBP7229822.1 lysine--tRNA ligase [Moraxellaceae bacterium]MBP8851882.1 lysine--tRNA ligase [Moraxellaceae bacterium]MBP9045078.1 lysine--tRNA ligase [Moraxellaceae bacterium]MBP9729932.1 lysine--tRNA ligase [Moraxellaceae bacterium]